jgi:hypothetical protein
LPEAVPDHSDRTVGSASTAVVRRLQRTTQQCGYAEHVEVRAADPHFIDEVRDAALGEIEAGVRRGQRAVEEVLVAANLFPDRVGPAGGTAVADDDETLRLGHRQ